MVYRREHLQEALEVAQAEAASQRARAESSDMALTASEAARSRLQSCLEVSI